MIRHFVSSRRVTVIDFEKAAVHAAFLICTICIFFQTSSAHAEMMREKLWLLTQTGESEISVEVAQSPQDMATGLMFRTSLASGQGMLFPSPTPHEATMWMHNTYIPLDMVFIEQDGRVLRVEANTEPLSDTIISSRGDVLAVLELPGGEAARLGLQPGDHVRHRLFQK